MLRLKTLFNIRHSSGSVVSHVGLAWSLLWGGFSDGCPTLVSFIFNIFGCGLYILLLFPYVLLFHIYCSVARLSDYMF